MNFQFFSVLVPFLFFHFVVSPFCGTNFFLFLYFFFIYYLCVHLSKFFYTGLYDKVEFSFIYPFLFLLPYPFFDFLFPFPSHFTSIYFFYLFVSSLIFFFSLLTRTFAFCKKKKEKPQFLTSIHFPIYLFDWSC